MKNPTVFLTGGEGLVGKALRSSLSNLNIPCFLIDNARKTHQKRYENEYNVTLDKPSEVNAKADLEHRCFIHLAAMSDVAKCEKEPALAHEANVVLTEQCLQFSKECQVNHFVFLSSGFLYGDKSKAAHTETEQVFPINVYLASKLKAEELIASFCKKDWEGTATVLRLSNVFGSESGTNTVLGKILDQVKNGNSAIEIFNGTPSRDFIYLKDVCEALIKLIQTEVGYSFDLFNLSNGSSLEIRKILALLESIVGGIELIETEKNLVIDSQLHIDNNKFKSCFDWEPSFGIQKGLEEIVKGYRYG